MPVRNEAGTKLDPQVVDACERLFREQGFAFATGSFATGSE
jgi:hypothetical protein